MFKKDLKPLTNHELEEKVKELKIKNFRGVFMRDTLPNKINVNEVGIVNLDSIKNSGTHWVCYCKNKDKRYYFDSFGLDPPIELQKYLGSDDSVGTRHFVGIEFSTFQIQRFNTHHCGYYCILILKLLEKYSYRDVILCLIS